MHADFDLDDVAAIIAGEKWESWLENHTEKKEKEVMEAAYEAYNQKHKDFPIGEAMIGGSSLSFLPDGVDTLLTFRFVVAGTGEPVRVPGLVSVRYEKQTDPPTELPVFEVLGVSSDAASDFAFPFTLGGFEPLIRAVPLDGLGNPLVVTGVVLMVFTGMVLVGGIRSIGRVTGTLVPVMILFYVLQKYLVGGLTAGAVKG